MGAFALVTLQIAGGPGTGPVAADVVARYAGTRSVTVSPAADSVAFELHFPGNLDGLVARLENTRISVGPLATISIPAEELAPEHLADAAHVAAVLSDGPDVWDPEFEPGAYVSGARYTGSAVEASIVPCTAAVHQLYDSLLHLGLTARAATVAAGAP